MSRAPYDSPHFDGQDGRISDWVASVPIADIPTDYFEENYDESDETTPFTKFSDEISFGFLNHEFAEMCASDRGRVTIHDILKPHSLSSSYAEAVSHVANLQGIGKTEYIFLMFDFVYGPSVTGISKSNYLKFVGCFDYDDHALSLDEVESKSGTGLRGSVLGFRGFSVFGL